MLRVWADQNSAFDNFDQVAVVGFSGTNSSLCLQFAVVLDQDNRLAALGTPWAGNEVSAHNHLSFGFNADACDSSLHCSTEAFFIESALALDAGCRKALS